MEDIESLPQTTVSRAHIIPLPTPFLGNIKHRPAKRTFDILFSLSTLLLLSPILLIIASLIKFSSKGNIFYKHTRVGRSGKPFQCYKFRTMYVDADKRLKEILANNPSLKEEWEKSYKLKNDPRVTPLGAFLRKTSLDEFPQFFNVLKGDLSIVGPRPLVSEEVQKFLGDKAHKILSQRPGITGVWQVSGRSDVTSYEKRVEMDEYYIENSSFLLDLKLIAKTIPAVLFSKGAY